MSEEPFKLDPVFAKLYQQHQEVSGYNGQLPAILNDIGPIRYLDHVRNEGEGRVGAIRVFVDLPPDESARILEMQFFPIDGQIRIETHRQGMATSGVVSMADMLWPGNAATSMAILHVAELLANDMHGTGSYASWDIRQMFQIPQGTGYRKLTLTAAKKLIEQRRVSLLSDVRFKPQVGCWYAYNKEPDPTRYERLDRLETYVGCLSSSPSQYLRQKDCLHLKIADRGQSEATIAWSEQTVSLEASHQNSIPRNQRGEYVQAGNVWIFEISEKLAQELQRFATPQFTKHSHDIALSLLDSPR